MDFESLPLHSQLNSNAGLERALAIHILKWTPNLFRICTTYFPLCGCEKQGIKGE